MTEQSLRDQICEVGRRLWQRELVGAAEGNISVRLDEERLLSTPSGVSKGHLRPEDMVIIDRRGNPLGASRPSSEIKMHLRIYDRRPDCMAVVHAHPPIASGFALAGETIPDDLLPEAAYVLGPVALVPFGMPGTDEVPNGLDPLLANHKTFLLANHGATVMGKDLFDALYRMETLERVARMIYVARVLGTPREVPGCAMAQIRTEILTGEL